VVLASFRSVDSSSNQACLFCSRASPRCSRWPPCWPADLQQLDRDVAGPGDLQPHLRSGGEPRPADIGLDDTTSGRHYGGLGRHILS